MLYNNQGGRRGQRWGGRRYQSYGKPYTCEQSWGYRRSSSPVVRPMITDHKIMSHDTATQQTKTAHQFEESLVNQSKSGGSQVTQPVPGSKMWPKLTASVVFKVLGHRHGVQAVAPYTSVNEQQSEAVVSVLKCIV